MNLHNSAYVTYETQILENGRVISRRPQKRNLLLDSGLNGIAYRSWWESFSRCVLGTGTTPTKRDSGAITVSIASGIATASAGFFEAGDVGRLLKLDSGQEAYIESYSSTTEVSLTDASDDAASEATIWYVNESGHGNEVVRTGTVGTDSGDVSSSWNGSTIEHKRTFVFPVETESRTYTEIGWSYTSTVGNNLLGRDLIPSGGDSIAAGQQYKVVVRLNISIGMATPQPVVDSGNGGFNTSGEIILNSVKDAFEGVSSPFRSNRQGFLEAWDLKRMFAVMSDFTLPATPGTGYTSPPTGSHEVTSSVEPYVSSSFSLSCVGFFNTGAANGTIYGCGIGMQGSSTPILLKFDTPQVKDSDHTLELKFTQTWGRKLVN